MDEESVSRWVHRFVDGGLDGLRDEARSGRRLIYTVEEVSLVIQTALTAPKELGLPFGSWTLGRLQAYLQEEKGLKMKRSRIDLSRDCELSIGKGERKVSAPMPLQ